MSANEEREVVRQYRAKTVMGAHEKREAIGRLVETMAAAFHRAPCAAAALLPEVWAARRNVDWGCRAVVV